MIRPRFEKLQAILGRLCPGVDERKLNALSFSVMGQCFHYRVAGSFIEGLIRGRGLGLQHPRPRLPHRPHHQLLPRRGGLIRLIIVIFQSGIFENSSQVSSSLGGLGSLTLLGSSGGMTLNLIT